MHRKVVTVLFCDVVGSTALGESIDPEALQKLLARYFERMKEIVERHGGTVDKFIGDAVMAVFGVPTVHEDDALRACSAAIEMREALPELGIEGRIGVNTGEVVTGTEERLATGDAVNVAARFQTSAEPGEILIGERTFALVRDAVEADAVEPLELKGKAKPVAAYRLRSVSESPERPHDTPYVGRVAELALIRDAWTRALGEGRCELVTILAEAGVGKSRLVAEALAGVDARVVRGRCLPYGEGITYWPVTEVVAQLADVEIDDRIRTALGPDADATPREIAWAFRKLVERAAPVAVVLDDVHWAEEAVLDLIEHVVLLASAPVLLVCMARPELLDRRSAWPVALRLEPLADDEVAQLLAGRAGQDVRTRITRASGGNPLFVQELIAMLDEESGDVTVPPTLQALLAARLDRLDEPDRCVLERGAVEGEVFHLGAVETLTPDEQNVPGRLASLVRRSLVQPDRAQIPGDDGFRFRHLLVRDAAYDALAKSVRADLHEQFAAWLEERGAGLAELDELVGYHLEQTVRYRRELGGDDSASARAAELLGGAGERALGRADLPGAANLLGRAVELAQGRRLVELLVAEAEALSGLGRLAEARAALERARAGAGDDALVAHVDLSLGLLNTISDPSYRVEEVGVIADRALPVFEAAGDDSGTALAWRARAEVALTACRWADSAAALEEALVHADRIGRPREVNVILTHLANALYWGATPASEGIERCSAILERARTELTVEANVACYLAGFRAMRGEFDEARRLITQGRSIFEELGHRVGVGAHTLLSSRVFLLAGEVDRAVDDLRMGYALFEEMGETGIGASVAGFLAEALAAQGTWEEAARYAAVSRETAADDDVAAQISWRLALARVELEQGSASELAAEAVELAASTDFLVARGDALATLADVRRAEGAADEAASFIAQAIALYEQKGDEVSASACRRRS